jgi:cyclohexyl-isocyanide hydratase
MRVAPGPAREAAEVEAVAATGIDDSIARRRGYYFFDGMQQGLGDAEIVQSPPPGNGRARVAWLPGSPVLGLEQVDVSAPRDIERMAARTEHATLLARQRQAAVADRAEEHASSVADMRIDDPRQWSVQRMPHHLNIGILIYPRMDQIDFTGPFEVFSRLPDSTVHVLWKEKNPLRDLNGLILTPETTLSEAPPLDLLQVPGGYGQEALMDDEVVLSFIHKQMGSGKYVFSVCTGALICGAAGILRGKRATTHWTAFDLLPFFGAIPVDSRVVEDGNLISSAGVTAGIDGALRVAALLRGDRIAQQIQLAMEYAPEPPFQSGSPKTAPPEILEALILQGREMKQARSATARRIAGRLGIRAAVKI